MKSGAALVAGIALALGAAWGGLWLVRAQVEEPRPARLAGDSPDVARGRVLYGRLGCAACHTQQLGSFDIAPASRRGWGGRRTTAPDYPDAAPAPIGTRRLGPDLSNVGARRPLFGWNREHLIAPRQAVPGSTMPSYAFLFRGADPRDGDDLVSYLLTLRRTAPPAQDHPAP